MFLAAADAARSTAPIGLGDDRVFALLVVAIVAYSALLFGLGWFACRDR